jgi:hypothetical protein
MLKELKTTELATDGLYLVHYELSVDGKILSSHILKSSVMLAAV